MKYPKNQSNVPQIEKNSLKSQHVSHRLNPGLKARPRQLATLFTLKLPPSHRNLFFCFFLLSTKTPPTVIHGFMARKELLGLHAARLQGATKYWARLRELMLERANYAFKPSKPRRQSQVLAGGTEICSSTGVRSREGAKRLQKVQVSLAVGALAARWRWSRGAAGAGPPCWCVCPPGWWCRGPGCGVRAASAGCQRDAINMRRKKQPACPAQSWGKGPTDSIRIKISTKFCS